MRSFFGALVQHVWKAWEFIACRPISKWEKNLVLAVFIFDMAIVLIALVGPFFV